MDFLFLQRLEQVNTTSFKKHGIAACLSPSRGLQASWHGEVRFSFSFQTGCSIQGHICMPDSASVIITNTWVSNVQYWEVLTLVGAGGLRKLPGKGWQALGSCKCVRVKHSFPPFQQHLFISREYVRDCLEASWFQNLLNEREASPHGLSSPLIGFKSACQMGWSQHLCSQMDASIFTKASSSEIHTKPLTLDFKINFKSGSLRYSAFRMVRKGFYSSPNLPELKYIKNFQLMWLCNWDGWGPLHSLTACLTLQYFSKRKCHCNFLDLKDRN